MSGGLNFPGEDGFSYQVAASLGMRPGIVAPGGTYIPLSVDPVLFLSLTDTGIFRNFAGTLATNARATASWRIPAIPALRGIRCYFAAVTISGGIRSVSNPIGVTVR